MAHGRGDRRPVSSTAGLSSPLHSLLPPLPSLRHHFCPRTLHAQLTAVQKIAVMEEQVAAARAKLRALKREVSGPAAPR